MLGGEVNKIQGMYSNISIRIQGEVSQHTTIYNTIETVTSTWTRKNDTQIEDVELLTGKIGGRVEFNRMNALYYPSNGKYGVNTGREKWQRIGDHNIIIKARVCMHTHTSFSPLRFQFKDDELYKQNKPRREKRGEGGWLRGDRYIHTLPPEPP